MAIDTDGSEWMLQNKLTALNQGGRNEKRF